MRSILRVKRTALNKAYQAGRGLGPELGLGRCMGHRRHIQRRRQPLRDLQPQRCFGPIQIYRESG